ncbi:MAG: hypothetical protein WCF26_04870 [Candidatus Sulfotelmatobacter sp.]
MTTLKHNSQGNRPSPFRFLVFLIALLGTSVCVAQTIRPVLSEYAVTAKGRVELTNDSTVPLTVIVTPKSFEVSETGEISYGPLSADIHLKLSAMSFRIAPKQSYYVFYEAKADKLPAWFVVYFEFSGFPVRDRSGLNMQVELPHTVYLLPKQSFKREDLEVSAQFDALSKKVIVTTFNKGTTVGRVLMTEAQGHGQKAQGVGFPIYPKRKRILELPWEGNTAPEKVILNLDGFKVERPVE